MRELDFNEVSEVAGGRMSVAAALIVTAGFAFSGACACGLVTPLAVGGAIAGAAFGGYLVATQP